MLFYALVNKHYKSADLMIEHMKGRELIKGRNLMTALSATLITPNYHYFETLVNWEGKKVDLHEVLVIVQRQRRSFISYVCKMHRKYEGQNEDINKIFKYL